MKIGARIKQIRSQQSLVLEEVARRIGMSKPYLSQVENDKATPSLQTLEKLAAAFNIPVSSFFLDETFSCHVIRKDERQQVGYGSAENSASQQRLLQFLSAPYRQLEVVFLEMPPGYAVGGPDHSHDGEECLLVEQGTLRATHGNESHILNVGDSFHWDGSLPHRLENIGNVTAKLLVARTPSGFMRTKLLEAGSGEEERR